MKEVRGSESLRRVKDEQDVDKLTNWETLTSKKKRKKITFLPAALISLVVFSSLFPSPHV